jgi:hypothetical protein
MRGVLVFDGRCGMCTRVVNRLARLNRTGQLQIEPLQAPGIAERLGVPNDRLPESAWWAGRIWRGLRRCTRIECGPFHSARHATAVVDLSTPRYRRAAKCHLPLGGGTPISLSRCDAALRGPT